MFGDHTIQMNRIFAEFISPIVSHICQSDPTIQCINFGNLYSNKKKNVFIKCTNDILSSDILSLLHDISSGFSIEIDNSQAVKLRFLSIILGNEELFNKINELFPPDFSRDNISSYIDFIQTCYHFSKFSSKFNFTGLIDHISRNFYSIEPDKILKLPRSIQYSIISNPHLQISSEDSLLEIINQINENDENSIEKVDTDEEKIDDILFYEHIEFPGLSEEKLREFLFTFDFNRMFLY